RAPLPPRSPIMTATDTTTAKRIAANERRAALTPLPRSTQTGPDGRAFPWGQIVTIHEISDFRIVEFLVDYSNTISFDPDLYDGHGKPQFHVYLDHGDGRFRSSRGYSSLDSAIVGAIAVKRD